MRAAVTTVAASLISFVIACGPAGRPNGGADDDGVGADAPTTGPEICDDAYDNDGDGRADCSDVDCSGVGNCPVCGSVENPQATPLALPDGISSGVTCSSNAACASTPATPTCSHDECHAACSTDADCASAAGLPNCVAGECHASYDSTLHFVGFPANATLTDPAKLLKVCLNIEHSYLKDLQIELLTPPDSSGVRRVIILDKWHDRTVTNEIYLGMANDSDEGSPPVPGVGADYCFTQAAPVPMIDANGNPGPTQPVPSSGPFPAKQLKPGDYKSMSIWTALGGVPLNGDWTMRVTDLWRLDNGFVFHWSISFDPTLVADCSGPIIL